MPPETRATTLRDPTGGTRSTPGAAGPAGGRTTLPTRRITFSSRFRSREDGEGGKEELEKGRGTGYPGTDQAWVRSDLSIGRRVVSFSRSGRATDWARLAWGFWSCESPSAGESWRPSTNELAAGPRAESSVWGGLPKKKAALSLQAHVPEQRPLKPHPFEGS